MNKFKITWRSIKVFLKKYWPLVAGSLGFILLFLMFLPVFRSSWLYYPESLRAKIAIQKLIDSDETAFYCREDCQANRLLYQKIITQAWANKGMELAPDLEKLIFNSKVLPETRRLVIKIWQDSGVAPSAKLKDFCNNSANSLAIRSDLAAAWPDLDNSSFYGELIGNFKTATSSEDKESLLNLLVGKDNPLAVNLIWDLILHDYPDNLKAKAFFLLANIDNKPGVYQAGDVANLRSVLESGTYPLRLKDKAIQVLDDYYSLYPEESEALLVDVINRPQYFDAYQRSFAIDVLNHYRTEKLPGLALSQADWDAYFTN